MIRQFFAFDPAFTGGVYVAAGDVNGDLIADIIVGADAGGGPQVTVFNGKDLSVLTSFFAYNVNFTGGVRVATGDVNDDEHADIICGAGPGGGPNVTVLSGANFSVLQSFFAYDPRFTAGVYVATGVFGLDPCGPADIVTGPGAAAAQRPCLRGRLVRSCRAFSLNLWATSHSSRFALGVSGVRVSTINAYGSGAAIVTHSARTISQTNVFDFATGTQIDTFSFFPHNPLLRRRFRGRAG